MPLRLDPVAIPDDLAYWLEAAQWVDVLDRPAADWLPAVLAALAPLGIAPPAPAPAPPEPLAGRAREQALLRERLAAALAGHGGLVLIGGEAGVGKTTLAEALLAEAAAQGALALTGRCYDLAETPPYGPWVELFGRYRPGRADPPLPPAVVADAGGAGGAVASQAALFAQVRGLARRPRRAPARWSLLLDDLHWADPASLDLLRVLARGARRRCRCSCSSPTARDELTRRHPLYALLPIARARGPRRPPRPAPLRRRRRARPRGRALRPARGRRGAPGRLAARRGRRATPSSPPSSCARWRTRARSRATADGWALGDLGAVGLPAPLRQVLDARLARLGEEAQRLLALAAVIGQEVPLALWAAVAETDEDGLLDTIERAVEAHLLRGGPGRGARCASPTR